MPAIAPTRDAFMAKTERRRLQRQKRAYTARMRRQTAYLRRRSWWRLMCQAAQGHCSYCLTPCDHLTVEHIQPIMLGGTCDRRNLVPVCAPCNTTKGNELLTVFLARKPHLQHTHHPLGRLDAEQGWVWSELGSAIVQQRHAAKSSLSQLYADVAGSPRHGTELMQAHIARLRWARSRDMRWPRRLAYRLLRCA